jgi:serpin B
MTDAFGAADFSGITSTPLHIRDVLQKATISVDESGTEATAATSIEFADAGALLNPLDFSVDRPFLLFVRDENGTLLFMGQVTNPAS